MMSLGLVTRVALLYTNRTCPTKSLCAHLKFIKSQSPLHSVLVDTQYQSMSRFCCWQPRRSGLCVFIGVPCHLTRISFSPSAGNVQPSVFSIATVRTKPYSVYTNSAHSSRAQTAFSGPLTENQRRTLSSCSTQRTHYDVLGLKPSATKQEIRDAFVALSKKWHPDANKEPGASAKFAEVYEAYKVLGKPGSRREYDLALKEEQSSCRQSSRGRYDRRTDPFRGMNDRAGFGPYQSDFNRHHHKYEAQWQRQFSEQDVVQFIQRLQKMAKVAFFVYSMFRKLPKNITIVGLLFIFLNVLLSLFSDGGEDNGRK